MLGKLNPNTLKQIRKIQLKEFWESISPTED